MIYKLSNAAEKNEIEKAFGIPFKYPNLYTQNPLIHGFHETNLSVVTMDNQSEITFAIWGLMPQNFREDWYIFQNNANTLNVQLQDLEQVEWMKESFSQRRCLIVVTGFYTHMINNGNTCSYYLCKPSEEPFFLAGVYNKLEDGFLCSALITGKTNSFVSSYHNISNLAPIIVPEDSTSFWLSNASKMEDLKDFIQNPPEVKLKANLMSNEFFLNNITYDL
ncbi:SOS response-associated peptidase family protein [Flagellimonas pelagia]|uniref:Abasic site processing protein n=1 Tax=Flagellimonas pelagia TaxID=2306998 RepID=A0A3A1NKV7_9FLAO|nr:SOS response-associated peptidase family protein [Allomuricauda maritima]RIV44194.1 hypothetical protein D2V05_11975 [Allomuricauda maritima]TXJ94110.1 hypothetical protein FQ017_11865 [Allomuricauda maritima]